MVTHLDPASETLREEILTGLRQQAKRWPCKLFYDYRGSLIFEEICSLEEYYLTRVETRILQDHIEEISVLCIPEAILAELGSGSSTKTRLLLNHMRARAYVPIDISRQQLFDSAEALGRDYPQLEIVPLCADYTQEFQLPSLPVGARRTIVFFPGSTVGNFEPPDATTFLGRIRTMCEPDGGMLIGVDLQKPKAVLERAYNDARGVTAAFNLNLLLRANRELGANFDLGRFRHRAIYNEREGRIEMQLVSLRAQTVRVGEASISFLPDEYITTEHSYKYTQKSFEQLAERAGFVVRQVWADSRRWFSVFFLTTDHSRV